MPGSSTSSTPMLLLLLLSLCISFHLSSSCKGLRDLRHNVKFLGTHVKNCTENCSTGHVTDPKCKCLNLSMSQEEYAFPKYFTTGLTSLHSSLSNNEVIEELVEKLNSITKNCNETDFSLLSVKYEPVISPRQFYKLLEDVREQIHTISS